MALQKKEYRVAVSRNEIEAWKLKVEALPARKQKSWKGSLVDKWGVRSTVRFRDGAFFNLVSEKKAADLRKEASERGMEYIVPDDLWVRILTIEDNLGKPLHAAAARLMDTVGTVDYDGTFFDIVDSTHTGNHGPRNHSIAVPTRAGEPVRG